MSNQNLKSLQCLIDCLLIYWVTEGVWGILIDILGSWVLLIVTPDNFENIRYIHEL